MAMVVLGSCKSDLNKSKADKTSEFKLFASEHSRGLDSFFNQALKDGMKTDLKGEAVNQTNIINKDYIDKTLSQVKFKELNFSPQTRAYSDVYNKVYEYLENIFPIVATDWISYEAMERNVNAYIASPDFVKIDKDCKEHVEFSLYILLDSYKYWIEEDGFGKWVANLYSEEDRIEIEKQFGVKVPAEFFNGNTTRMSPGDRMIWSEAAKLDAKNGGKLWKIAKADMFGFLTGGIVGYTVESAIAALS